MASQSIHTYLTSRRRRKDSEAEDALACLPKDTRVFQYESIHQLEAAIHSMVDDAEEGFGYCVFGNVPEHIVDGDLEAARVSIGRITYFPISGILISKTPGGPLEVASGWLRHALSTKAQDMGIAWQRNIVDTGSKKVEHKEPDSRCGRLDLFVVERRNGQAWSLRREVLRATQFWTAMLDGGSECQMER